MRVVASLVFYGLFASHRTNLSGTSQDVQPISVLDTAKDTGESDFAVAARRSPWTRRQRTSSLRFSSLSAGRQGHAAAAWAWTLALSAGELENGTTTVVQVLETLPASSAAVTTIT